MSKINKHTNNLKSRSYRPVGDFRIILLIFTECLSCSVSMPFKEFFRSVYYVPMKRIKQLTSEMYRFNGRFWHVAVRLHLTMS